MEEPYFWINTAVYYILLIGAINGSILALILMAPVLTRVQTSTDTELIPGMREIPDAQIEILKTQRYLDKKGYYENVQ